MGWIQRQPRGQGISRIVLSTGRGSTSADASPRTVSPDRVAKLNEAFTQRFGTLLFRPHTDSAEVFNSCHRFKSLSASGLYQLAKEVVRVIVEHIDTAPLQKLVPPPDKEKWASLKSLEKVLATVIGEDRARAELGPLHGVYNLRLADAHTASSDLDEAYRLARVDKTLPFVMQGRNLLITCVMCLHRLAEAFK
jgi:hypothetical protein